MSQPLPWTKINDFLLTCGSIRDHKEYCKHILDHIGALIPYDQGRIYFINDNGIVYDEYLIGVDKQVTSAYHEYYSKVENGRYSLFSNTQNGRKLSKQVEDCVHDWTEKKMDEFLSDHLRPQGIRYSFGFGLRDTCYLHKAGFMLDRVSAVKFSHNEIMIMQTMKDHLENLFMNFYVDVPNDNAANTLKPPSILTAREAEVAELLSKGVTPANISKRLYISPTTVYKHISHIHGKLNVTNRQELIVRLLQESKTQT